jgi:mannose-6-phosphate isomerase-like protein (cupin superfamily)
VFEIRKTEKLHAEAIQVNRKTANNSFEREACYAAAPHASLTSWPINTNEDRMIKNFLQVPKKQITSHDGVGKVDLYQLWDAPDFNSNIDFFRRYVIPSKSSIGYHKHGNNEELYIILKGRGTMTIGQKEITVEKGDIIKNPPFGWHGLVNDSEENLDLLVFQVSIDE